MAWQVYPRFLVDQNRWRAMRYGIDQGQIDFATAAIVPFQEMLQDIAPGSKSTCGLSNISNGPPEHLRPILNQTYMVMLERKGMYSCIANAYDDGLVDIARGNRPDIVEVIHKVMDNESIDMDSLSKELQDIAKTARVILGQSLYSDSWLEL